MSRLAAALAWSLAASVAQAGVVLPDDCAAHSTPPPMALVEQAVRLQEEGYLVVRVLRVPQAEVNRRCEQESGLADPVGFPGRRFGACNILDVSGLPMRSLIIIPSDGREGALCHELAHAAGWPWSHPQ